MTATGFSLQTAGATRPFQDWLVRAVAHAETWASLKTYVDQQTEAVVFSLARSLEGRDPCTQGHCERLSAYAGRLGRSLGLPDEYIEALVAAGIVHDIGKVAVPDDVLLKPGPLDSGERRIMQQHPVVGEHICAPLKSFRRVLPIIRHHHERMDGSGYPDGLKNEEIPLTARILQTVDIYDALTADRPYRKALPIPRALAVMGQEAERGWLDRALVGQLEHLVEDFQQDARYVGMIATAKP